MGEISKLFSGKHKTLAIVGVVGGALIIWYLMSRGKASSASGATSTSTSIDPETGYPAGSAEDEAALQQIQQTQYTASSGDASGQYDWSGGGGAGTSSTSGSSGTSTTSSGSGTTTGSGGSTGVGTSTGGGSEAPTTAQINAFVASHYSAPNRAHAASVLEHDTAAQQTAILARASAGSASAPAPSHAAIVAFAQSHYKGAANVAHAESILEKDPGSTAAAIINRNSK